MIGPSDYRIHGLSVEYILMHILKLQFIYLHLIMYDRAAMWQLVVQSAASNLTGTVPVSLQISGSSQPFNTAWSFEYRANPEFSDIYPRQHLTVLEVS